MWWQQKIGWFHFINTICLTWLDGVEIEKKNIFFLKNFAFESELTEISQIEIITVLQSKKACEIFMLAVPKKKRKENEWFQMRFPR